MVLLGSLHWHKYDVNFFGYFVIIYILFGMVFEYGVLENVWDFFNNVGGWFHVFWVWWGLEGVEVVMWSQCYSVVLNFAYILQGVWCTVYIIQGLLHWSWHDGSHKSGLTYLSAIFMKLKIKPSPQWHKNIVFPWPSQHLIHVLLSMSCVTNTQHSMHIWCLVLQQSTTTTHANSQHPTHWTHTLSWSIHKKTQPDTKWTHKTHY